MQDLLCVNVELAVYRKGCLSVQLDFQEGIMTWMESRQWCNNFVRSLSDEQIRETIGIVCKSGLLDAVPAAVKTGQGELEQTAGTGDRQPAGSGEAATGKQGSLQLSLSFAESQVELAGDAIDPTAWASLRSQIEKLSRVPFQL